MIKKKICILGSTGSIGRSTLEIISKNKKDFDVVLLSGNNNIKLLISQAKKFKPKYIYSNNFYLIQKIKYFCIRNHIVIINDYIYLSKSNRFFIKIIPSFF
jgi:1-deoxy-D-xylulose-5-phosphate reductoisomerase